MLGYVEFVIDFIEYMYGDFPELAQSGTPVYAVEDGFVSRISVSPYGYGLAVYIDHPRIGVTTVYGHLDRFAPFIDDIVKMRQYAQESFSVNFFLKNARIRRFLFFAIGEKS